MKKNAYLKQSAAEKYDIKEASNQNLSAEARKHYARNAQFDSKSFEQKIDGDMGSFDVMSEPAPVMSRSANKVNHIAAGRSKFMQAKEEEEKPKEFKIDRQATNAANMEILKDNQAISASNAANAAEVRRFNAAAAIDFAKNKRAIEEANKGIDEKNRIEKAWVAIENKKSTIRQYDKTQNPKSKKKKVNKGNKPNPFSGFAGDRKKKK